MYNLLNPAQILLIALIYYSLGFKYCTKSAYIFNLKTKKTLQYN